MRYFRIYRALQELDRQVNRVFGGEYPETLSARWAKNRHIGCQVCHFLCLLLEVVDRGHCDRSHAYYRAVQEGIKEAKEALDKVNKVG